MVYDHASIEGKWQAIWEERGTYHSEPDPGRPKFFLNMPYPYSNGVPHLGHAFTYTSGEVLCRYKRMQGFNVLFPYAFHCTGTPIVAAADRIKEGEPGQTKIMGDMGIPESDIPKFADAEHWTRHFPGEIEKDMRRLGVSVDWRRKFITTSLNPYYDAFIRWQFTKLHELGFVRLGEHPIIWCPKCNSPVGDHARHTGEGETPQEFTLLKFKLEETDGQLPTYMLAATLRPETVYGQTNLWVDPKIEYVKARASPEKSNDCECDDLVSDVPTSKEELWIVSRECAQKLSGQGWNVQVSGTITGKDLLGKLVMAPGIQRKIPILPSQFCNPSKGTGIVTSVPSDAPDDWMGLHDLQNDPDMAKQYGLDLEMIKAIDPIAIISSEGWGGLPAVEICKKLGVQDQNDRVKLDAAKKEIYKTGFYTGVMTENAEEFNGQKVEFAKEAIKEKMLKEGNAHLMWEPTGAVVCRCLTPSVVQLVSNQWFMAYDESDWKEKVHGAIADMELFPASTRKQFDYVVDWLHDWPCTREHGLGTRLPWDDKWMIESLSDSTVYMAYYTISRQLEQEHIIEASLLDTDFFDYVFLGNGIPSELALRYECTSNQLEQMRAEFTYWYPFDMRRSGKDLIQNHLTFTVFHHTALFPKKLWPKGFGVNGWVLVDGEKMSKSKGNFMTLRQVLDKLGADVTRLSLMYGGDGIDDPNWDTELADSFGKRLDSWLNFARSSMETLGTSDSSDAQTTNEPIDATKIQTNKASIDRWFLSRMADLVDRTTQAFESMSFRNALKLCYFDLQKEFKWYQRRTANKPNLDVLATFLEVQTKLLAPFAPHLAEEVWEILGKPGLASNASWPNELDGLRDEVAENGEDYLRSVMDDINEIRRIVGTEPTKITLYTAPEWKLKVYAIASSLANGDSIPDMGTIIKQAMAEPDVKNYSKHVPNYVKKLVNALRTSAGKQLPQLLDEKAMLDEAIDFLRSQFNVEMGVFQAGHADSVDPAGKSKAAIPGRPAIYLE